MFMYRTFHTMDVLVVFVQTRLWTQGTTSITFGPEKDWCFYYALDGVRTKQYMLLFYNAKLRRVYFRNHLLDLKLRGVVLQKSKFVSNIYRLRLEATNKVEAWIPSVDKSISTVSPHLSLPSFFPSGGIVKPSKEEVYFCSPPILVQDRKDRFDIVRIPQTPPCLPIGASEYSSACGGYTVYTKQSKSHKEHANRTWIPSIVVNAETFVCSLAVDSSRPRHPLECLECSAEFNETYNPVLSNLIINH